jgi:hypothetical protein
MKCPKCQREMRVVNTYQAGDHATTQRLACICGTVGTVQAILVNVDPPHGQGARALAEKIRKKGLRGAVLGGHDH